MSEFTPGEASKLLSVPPSTLRRYVSEFGEKHLSAGANRARGRVFTEHDLSVLSRIRDLTQAGLRLSAIDGMLENIVTPEEQEELPPPSALMMINRISEQQENLQVQVSQLLSRIDDLETRERERSRSLLERLFRRK